MHERSLVSGDELQQEVQNAIKTGRITRWSCPPNLPEEKVKFLNHKNFFIEIKEENLYQIYKNSAVLEENLF